MKRIVGAISVVALLLSLLAFLGRKAGEFDSRESEDFQAALWQIKHLDARGKENVLKLRFGLVNHYDGFEEIAAYLDSSLETLNRIPMFVTPEGRGIIEAAIADYTTTLLECERLLEQFKTRNAMVGNSRRYFPTAIEQLTLRLTANPAASQEDKNLRSAVDNLARLVLKELSTPEDLPETAKIPLQELKEWSASHPEYPESRFVFSLVRHAEIIVSSTEEVDELTQELVALPTDIPIQNLLSAYESEVAGAWSRSNQYRQLLYALVVLTIIGLTYTLWALRVANRNLEGRVKDRTSELEAEMSVRKAAEAKLIETSRQAGMAEIATGILHNVGNVLNSVNVASNCIASNLRESKVSNLPKIVELLRAHSADLGNFLMNDRKGKQLPGYIAQLSDHLLQERARTREELAEMQKHIEHIKDIVAMQQNFAHVSGVTETVDVKNLVEDALQMDGSSLMRYDVKVTKELRDVPSITTEKHKVLQILINLLVNAKEACEEANPDDKQVTVRIENGGDRVRISVSDNGVGIPDENLTRIFNHGFTTKKEGHGFGLHSSANAATEIGGTLSVHSDGLGQGATFTLELPMNVREKTVHHREKGNSISNAPSTARRDTVVGAI